MSIFSRSLGHDAVQIRAFYPEMRGFELKFICFFDLRIVGMRGIVEMLRQFLPIHQGQSLLHTFKGWLTQGTPS